MVNDTTAGKTCRDCGAAKAPGDFNKHPKTRDGLQPHCRDCQRARNARHYRANKPLYEARIKQWRQENPERVKTARRLSLERLRGTPEFQEGVRRRWLKHKYGITPAEYDALLMAQGGGCGVCGANEQPTDGKRFHVDHDHGTGKVRGVLCQPCNIILGLANDNCDTLAAAILYLKQAQSGG